MQQFNVKIIKILLRCLSVEHYEHVFICCTLILSGCQNLKAMAHYFVCRSSSLLLSKSDSAPCRYFTMPGGCVRGEKCLFSHPNAEIMSVEMGQSFMPKQVGGTKVFYLGGAEMYPLVRKFYHPNHRKVVRC